MDEPRVQDKKSSILDVWAGSSYCWFLVAVVGAVQGLLFAYTAKLTADQAQLLVRGIRVTEFGIWMHHGSAITSGGHVPGTLLTLFMALPMMVWDSPWAPEILITLIQLASALIMNHALKDHLSPRQRFVFFCLFWLNPWRASKNVIWNPSYLFLPAAIHFLSSLRLANASQVNEAQPRQTARRLGLWSMLHVGAIGMAVQIHASALVLLVASVFLLLQRKIRIHIGGALAGTLIVALSLAPYFLMTLRASFLIPVINKTHGDYFYGKGLVDFFPMLKGILYWPRFSSSFFPSYIFNEVEINAGSPQLSSLLDSTFLVVRYVAGGASMIISAWAFYWIVKRFFKSKFNLSSSVESYFLAMFVGIFFSSAISPIVFSHWHLLIAFPMAILSLVWFLEKGFPRPDKNSLIILSLISYFVFYNFVSVFVSKYHSFTKNVHTEYPSFKKGVIAKTKRLGESSNL